jgi:hypothetical protein
MGVTTKIYHSSDQSMPWQDWEQVIRQSNDDAFSMDPRFLTCVESSITGASKIWYVLFYSDSGTPIASACLSNFQVDLAIVAGPAVQRTMATLRRLMPSLLYMNVMFCGQPVSLGQKNLLFTPQASPEEVLAELDGLMFRLARQEKGRFIVYKEHSKQDMEDLQSLDRLGYRRVESLDMYIFEEPFQDFDHYLSNLSSHYRYDVRRSLRKLEGAGVEVVRWTDTDTILERYNEESHKLYLAVVGRSETKLEILPVAFFHDLARQFPGQVALTGLVKDNQILAFNWSLFTDSKYQFLFCGIDYSVNNKLDLYFNLMYSELGYALESGANEIKVGQTAAQFKTRLGCTQRPLHLFIRGSGFVTRTLLKLFSSLLFPPREEVQTANIYNSKYKPNHKLSQN